MLVFTVMLMVYPESVIFLILPSYMFMDVLLAENKNYLLTRVTESQRTSTFVMTINFHVKKYFKT